ncbi:MerR family transcriptional regulator [Streptomyces sp. SP18CS02]|uniref:MerR family transcriptional regulator n=1 Tax=Streptomyces sp. SP18CS02 TaxID=3002531 RepID=UPI002E767EF0|nr:MerR family transcriptional regulator [Streptomyces sp. SP18CS02]MEE1753248.1 MerR family transcriptional regulator [Streptomyces sp. SP18CS02]
MRIGEIAGLVGITARAVRHYHHLGLLPEPRRLANGYRDYSLRDAVLLARVRRLTELGLGLDEVRDVLADDAGRELVEVLEELDADLERQQEHVRERRERLAGLLEPARAGRLPAEGPLSPQLAGLFEDMTRAAAALPGPEPAMAARDREMLALLDAVAPDEEDGMAQLVAALRRTMRAPGAVERAYDLYARLDALDGAAPGDPAVAETARAMAGLLPDEVAERLKDADLDAGAFEGAFFAEFSAAQAEAVRQALQLVAERGRGQR